MGCKCANAEEESDEINQQNGNNENNENEENKFDIFEKNTQNGYLQENNQEKNEDMNYNENNIYKHDNHIKYADYPEKIVEIINNIRENPPSYADTIEESIQNIVEEEDKNDPSNLRLIYKNKVKVALNKGESAFIEAANILRTMEPLPPLLFKKEICIPLPEIEEEMKDSSFLKEQVRIIKQSENIDVFFKDLIKIPEVSALLMVVDDSHKNAGKKRMAVLSKELKYIGVTSKFIGKTFIAYFAFSK